MTSRIFTDAPPKDIPFSRSGDDLLRAAISQCASGKTLTRYGELVLHIASQMNSDRARQLLKSALQASDEDTVKCTLAYVDASLSFSNSKDFWQQPIDNAVQGAGFYLADVWKQLGLPTNPNNFQMAQSFLFGAGVINFVAVVGADSSSRAVIERSLKTGLLGRLFG